jgi:hypothetical protein
MKKVIGGISLLVLLNGCAGIQIPEGVKGYQMQKSETIMTEEYVIQKQEILIYQKVDPFKKAI